VDVGADDEHVEHAEDYFDDEDAEFHAWEVGSAGQSSPRALRKARAMIM
jgi:hypothetical protein